MPILAISCLTTSNLPWFMDLTFQVLLQYFSLQHQTLLSPPDTSTTECPFCFGPVPSFFLELFLYSSPVAYLTSTSNQSILKEISPEYSLDGLMLKLKLQYFGRLMQRTDSLEKTLILGKIEGRRRRGQQRMRCGMASLTQWTWVWASSRSWWWTGKPGVLQSMGLQRVGHDWKTKLNWNSLNKTL